jgi:hypothetical protein
LPIKFKAPNHLAKAPEVADFAELKNRWSALRAQFAAFLEAQPLPVFEAEIWKHQVAGKMNLYQMLDFFDDHFERHRRQINRLLK